MKKLNINFFWKYQDSSVIFKDGEIIESDLQNSKEILDFVKNLKKYNPRIIDYTLEKQWKEKETKKSENSTTEE